MTILCSPRSHEIISSYRVMHTNVKRMTFLLVSQWIYRIAARHVIRLDRHSNGWPTNAAAEVLYGYAAWYMMAQIYDMNQRAEVFMTMASAPWSPYVIKENDRRETRHICAGTKHVEIEILRMRRMMIDLRIEAIKGEKQIKDIVTWHRNEWM